MEITQKDLDAALKGGEPLGVYVFTGSEDYMADHYIRRFETLASAGGLAGLDIKKFTGMPSCAEFCDAVLAVGQGGFALTVVRGADFSGYSAGERAYAVECMQTSMTGSCLILRCSEVSDLESKPKKTAKKNKKEAAAEPSVTRFIEEAARICAFPPSPKPSLVRWIKNMASAKGASFPEEVCALLLERRGTYMYDLKNEVDKLCAYSLETGEPVSAEMIRMITREDEQIGAFELSDAMLAGDTSKILAVIAKHERRRDEVTLPLSAVSRYFCDLFAVRLAVSANLAGDDAISAASGIHPYRVRLYLRRLDSVPSPDEYIKSGLERCRACDLAVKTTNIDEYTALVNAVLCE